MRKDFKAGDRVIIKSEDCFNGKKGTILQIDNGIIPYYVDLDKDTTGWCKTVEHIKEPDKSKENHKFKVGDIIVGNEVNTNKYVITTVKRNFVGEVIGINPKNKDEIKVKVLENNNKRYIRGTYLVESKYFVLKGETSTETVKDDFNNTKVYVATPEESEAVQKRMFELGFKWNLKHSNKIEFTNKKYLYFEDDKRILMGDGEYYFESCDMREVTVQDILECTIVVDAKDLIGKPVTFEEKLIKNKMETKDIEKIDVKILKAAKDEVELERAKRQQEAAAEYYRNLMEQKDEVEKVVKKNQENMKEINRELKVFNAK